MKKDLLLIISTLVLTIALAGCGNIPSTPQTPAAAPATETESVPPTITVTPDPCSPGQIEAEVQKVHKHMREFDDASILASSTPREQLSGSIADLQRIRREAEDETIPACLTMNVGGRAVIVFSGVGSISTGFIPGAAFGIASGEPGAASFSFSRISLTSSSAKCSVTEAG